jgi:hypothetical protein
VVVVAVKAMLVLPVALGVILVVVQSVVVQTVESE